MPDARPEVLDFLLTRRSRPAKTLGLPVPAPAALAPLLEAAARSPDHGKLEPWRFVVLQKAALDRLAALTDDLGAAKGLEPERREKARRQFADADLAIAVVAAPVPSEKVPDTAPDTGEHPPSQLPPHVIVPVVP